MPNREMIEDLRWKKFPVLNDGFVCLVDVMGDDEAIVQAARTSYGDGTRQISDNRTLLRYLMRHLHTTPFEMAEIKFLVRVPMDCWRQWIRHRTASVNEYSTRYSIAIDSSYQTEPNEWRRQSTSNRQGSEGMFSEEEGKIFTETERKFHQEARDLYESRVAAGIAREQARKDLPLSTYTEAYWKVDLHNLFHFLALRMESNAQQEIVQYATTMGENIVKPLFPLAWQAFLDYRLNAMRLSALDQGVIQRLTQKGKIPASFEEFSLCGDPSWQDLARCRERDECFQKLVQLGICSK